MSRRRALAGAATLGVGVPLLAACGDDGSTADDPAGDPSSDAPSADPSSAPPAETDTASTAPDGGALDGLVAADEVPVGGGVILEDEELVVTQPAAGDFKAFEAICTHQGCLVGSVTGGQIVCPCHGSTFSISDGSNEGGPASGPLASVAVTLVDGQVQRS
ncbi:Rieske (2Fe-2S) protein [Nocardioides humi]|uniref:Cytochrome bc1 complex Rieske iron-sulfur subunit n=1 Tax=Nocardioides humi TaxID=449461 RepID=A0ABN2BAJ4_9ACTN